MSSRKRGDSRSTRSKDSTTTTQTTTTQQNQNDDNNQSSIDEDLKAKQELILELSLFYSMIDHKPVGLNKHFHMIFIHEKLNSLSEKKYTAEELWQYLGTIYDLNALVNTNSNLYKLYKTKTKNKILYFKIKQKKG
jgi:hypothetical protein